MKERERERYRMRGASSKIGKTESETNWTAQMGMFNQFIRIEYHSMALDDNNRAVFSLPSLEKVNGKVKWVLD